MVGITSYGAYIPIYRLSRAEIARAWEKNAGAKEKAVANYDEDSLTMAVEAAIDCLNGMDRCLVDNLYFATTTPVYGEKQNASIIAAVADLREDIFASDVTGSIRSATIALKMAVDAIKAGSAKQVLVTAADLRLGPQNSEFEATFGDGAGALLLGDSNIIATIDESYSISSEFLGQWRKAKDYYVQCWEDRFVREEGYFKFLPRVVFELLKKNKLAPKDFTKLILYAPDARQHRAMAKELGFDYKTQVQDPMFDCLGNSGVAFTPMMLVAALEEANPGDTILLAGYGDGADAFVLRVTDEIKKVKNKRGIKRHLESKMPLSNYEKYLHFRKFIEFEGDKRPPPPTYLPLQWRERHDIYRCYGSKCRQCGTIQYPIQRVCVDCQAKDDYDETRLSDQKGKIFTFSMDDRANVAELPLVLNIINFDEGGRFYSTLTDRDIKKVEVGMPVELTFRKMHEEGGLVNYFWKSRPIRVKQGE